MKTLLDAQWAALERVMAIAEFALDGQLMRANDNYLALFGYRAEQVTGQHHAFFCRADDAAPAAHERFWRPLCAGEAYSGQVERLREGGRSCWLQTTYMPIMDDAGQVRQIMQIAIDITTRLLHEQEQQQHLRQLSLVADASDSAVMISDAGPYIVYVNAGFCRMFGWTAEEVQGRRPIGLLAPDKDAAYAQQYRDTLAQVMDDGVDVLAWRTAVSTRGLELNRALPFSLDPADRDTGD